MNFLSQLNELLHSGHGFGQSIAYRAYTELPLGHFLFQCAYCLSGIAAGRLISQWLYRRIREKYPAPAFKPLCSFIQHVGPSIQALVALLLPIALYPLFLGHGLSPIVISEVVNLVIWVLPVRLAGWILRDLMRPHDLLRFFLWATEWFIILAAVLAFFGLLYPSIGLIQSLNFTIGDQVFKGENIVFGVLMALVALTIAWQTMGMATWGVNRYADRERMPDNDARVLTRLLSLFIFLSTAIGVLISSGIEGSSLAAFGGALGIGLGLGLKELAANYFSGIFVLLEKAIKIGDHVTINAITGRVVNIGTRAIVIRDGTGTESIVPNSIATNGILKNHTLSNPDFRISFPLKLRNIEDFENARRVIQAQLSVHPRVLQTPKSDVQITSVLQDEVALEISLWINDLDRGRGPLISELYYAIGSCLQGEGIALASAANTPATGA